MREHLDAHRHPGDRAAGLDRPAVVRVALGLLARGEPAVVVPVEFDDAPPQVLERRPILGFAGDPVQLGQREDRMQALPPRLGRAVERLAGEPAAEVVAGHRLAVGVGRGEFARRSAAPGRGNGCSRCGR